MCMCQAVAPVPRTNAHLLRIVSTLEADFMHAQPPKSLEQLEQYAEGSSSQLLYLQVAASALSWSDSRHVHLHACVAAASACGCAAHDKLSSVFWLC